MFRRAFEEIIGVLHDKLIERRRGSHQNGAGTAATAPSAACTLPSGCNGAWIPGHDRGIERSDVNSKFQRVGRYHAANAAFPQAALDLATLARQVTSAIAANRGRLSRRHGICLRQIGE